MSPQHVVLSWPVVKRYLATALTWLVPSALLLPVVLLLLAMGAATGDSAFAEMIGALGKRLIAGLGPLLLIVAIAGPVFAATSITEPDWVFIGSLAALAALCGVVCIGISLRRIAREMG